MCGVFRRWWRITNHDTNTIANVGGTHHDKPTLTERDVRQSKNDETGGICISLVLALIGLCWVLRDAVSFVIRFPSLKIGVAVGNF
jgi:hypothetical protein